MTRIFAGGCACGAIRYETSSQPIVAVHAGSLDDPRLFKPQMVTYTIRGHAWDTMDPSLPKFGRMP